MLLKLELKSFWKWLFGWEVKSSPSGCGSVSCRCLCFETFPAFDVL